MFVQCFRPSSRKLHVAKAPLLAEYSFFGQMGVEQVLLMENDRRFWDSDSGAIPSLSFRIL